LYYGRLVERLGYIFASPEDAEDAAQDVWLRVHDKWDSYDRTWPFWPWLSTIAYRYACTLLRRRRGNVPLDEETHPVEDTRPGPALNIETREMFERVLQVLRTDVPEAYRVPFTLHYLEGWKYEDVSKAVGIVVSAAFNRVANAMRLIRERLRRDGHEV
jgi:RNA polymerase sigma-70 factor (ECF subfamily)